MPIDHREGTQWDNSPFRITEMKNKRGDTTYANVNMVSPINNAEWKHHKYLYKVKTKTGQIRYVYETPNGKVSYGRNSEYAKRAQKMGGDGRRSNRYRENREETTRLLGWQAKDVINDISKGDFGGAYKQAQFMVGNIARSMPTYFMDQVSDTIDSVRQFLHNLKLPF